MILVHAEPADLPRLLAFRRDAAGWLSRSGAGGDQWSNPASSAQIAESIAARTVFLLKDGPVPAATVTVDRAADPRIWSAEEAVQPAMYVHKLTVDRAYAGRDLGGRLLDWAGARALSGGARWLRLDAWTTNQRLHAYYLAHGFTHVRTVRGGDVVSGWAAQRPTARAVSACDFDDRSDALSPDMAG